jgi:putative transposase
MATHRHASHNKSLIIFHLVCPVKYRRKVFTSGNEVTFKSICLDLAERYNISFLEIGTDKDHVHFLFQTSPNINISETVKKIKSITASQMFKHHPEVKIYLWGGEFWTDGYYINTVGQYGNLKMLENYVKKQGLPDYRQVHHQMQSLGF